MKAYFTFIKYLQVILLTFGIGILLVLPSSLTFAPDWFDDNRVAMLYVLTHTTLFFVMMIRPLADLFRGVRWLRPLVILRKGAGVLSASVVVSFILSKIMVDAGSYFAAMITGAYWSFTNMAIAAHSADIAAVLLLVTSNNLSKRVLGRWWKRIQRLSYVYFYGSGLYVTVQFGDKVVLWYLILVTVVTTLAYMRNHGFILKKKS